MTVKPARSTSPDPGLRAEERLRAAIKSRDIWWATIFSGRVANRIVAVLGRYPTIHPNHVTLFGLCTAIIAAVFLSLGTYVFTLAGAFLVQAAFILDCADGQLARYRGQTSTFGAILDRVLDRVKLPLYLLALAWAARGKVTPELSFSAAFVGSMGFLLVDLYREQFFLLVRATGSGAETEDRTRLALPLRALDLPLVRLNGGEHAFLVSVFCLLDQGIIPLFFAATVSLAQILFRPLYYLHAFHRTHRTWPWRVP